ncbi:MAG: hypothetical protein OXL38_00250 [Gammaproteobacteria bacterium]|nr:hypothetical protein [Gammaproteobacteria bacterium]
MVRAAFDPETSRLYVPSQSHAILVKLERGDPRTEHRYRRAGPTSVGGADPEENVDCADAVDVSRNQKLRGDGPRGRRVRGADRIWRCRSEASVTY